MKTGAEGRRENRTGRARHDGHKLLWLVFPTRGKLWKDIFKNILTSTDNECKYLIVLCQVSGRRCPESVGLW